MPRPDTAPHASDASDAVTPEHAESSTRRGTGPSRGRRLRWVTVVGAVGMGLLIALAAMTPTLLSRGPAAGWLTGRINATIDGRVEVDSLRVRWFGPADARGVTLHAPDGGRVAWAERVSLTRAGLWAWLRGDRDFGVVTAHGLRAELHRRASGGTNLHEALRPPHAAGGASFSWADRLTPPAAWRGTVRVSDTRATLDAAGIDTIRIALDGELGVEGRGRLSIQGTTTLEQGDDGGTARLALRLEDAHRPGGRFELDADTQLDLKVVDHLLGQPERWTALLGPTLDASIAAAGTLTDLEGELAIESKHLRGGAAVTAQNGRTTVTPGAGFALTLTPRAFARWTAGQSPPDSPRLALADAVHVSIAVRDLWLGRSTDPNAAAAGLTEAGFELDLTTPELALVRRDGGRTVQLQRVNATVLSASLDDGIDFALAARAGQADAAGRLTVGGRVTGLLNQAGSPDWGRAVTSLDVRAETWAPTLLTTLLGDSDAIAAVLSPTFDAAASLRVVRNPSDAGRHRVAGNLAVQSAQGTLDAKLQGRLASDAFTLDPATRVTARLEPEAARPTLHTLLAARSLAPSRRIALPPLDRPLVLHASIDEARWPRDGGSPTWSGRLRSEALGFRHAVANDVTLQAEAVFRDVALDRASSIQLIGEARQGDLAAELTGRIDLVPVAGGLQPTRATLAVEDAPVAALDALAAMDGRLLDTLGSTLDRIDLTAARHPADNTQPDTTALRFVAQVASRALDASLGGVYTPGRSVTLDPGSALRWSLSPASARHWLTRWTADKSAARFALERGVDAAVAVDAFAWQAPEAGGEPTLRGEARLAVSPVYFRDTEAGHRFAIEDLAVELTSSDLTEGVALLGEASVKQRHRDGSILSHGRVSGSTVVRHTTAPPASPNADAGGLRVESDTLAVLPTGMLDTLRGTAGQLSEALGETLETRLVAKLAPSETDTVSGSLTAKGGVFGRITAERDAEAEAFTWRLEGRAAPLARLLEARGGFDPASRELTVDQLDALMLMGPHEHRGVLALLPPAWAERLASHRVSLGGKLQVRDARVPIFDPMAGRGRVRATLDQAIGYVDGHRLTVRDARVDLSLEHAAIVLHRADLGLAGGRVVAWGQTDLADPRGASAFAGTMEGCRLGPWVEAFLEPGAPAMEAKGVIDGRLERLTFDVAAPLLTLSGRGELRLRHGVLTPLPFVREALGDAVASDPMRVAPDDRAWASFFVSPRGLEFRRVHVITPRAELRNVTPGRVGFDGRGTLQLKVLEDAEPDAEAPLRTTLGEASRP